MPLFLSSPQTCLFVTVSQIFLCFDDLDSFEDSGYSVDSPSVGNHLMLCYQPEVVNSWKTYHNDKVSFLLCHIKCMPHQCDITVDVNVKHRAWGEFTVFPSLCCALGRKLLWQPKLIYIYISMDSWMLNLYSGLQCNHSTISLCL